MKALTLSMWVRESVYERVTEGNIGKDEKLQREEGRHTRSCAICTVPSLTDDWLPKISTNHMIHRSKVVFGW